MADFAIVLIQNHGKLVCTFVHAIIKMYYQWDQNKAESNFRKHDLEFADAVSIFSDNLAVTIPDDRFDENRFVTIGMDAFGK